jgi:gliding motility-associated-like protein
MMKQLKGSFLWWTLVLFFVLCVSIQTASAQSCSITIETSRAGNININNGITYFTLKVDFGQSTTKSAVVTFNKNIDFAFDSPNPTVDWTGDNECSIKYTTTGSFSQTAYDVQAIVQATSTGGEDVSCQSLVFQVDKTKPDCAVTCDPLTITPENTGNFVITVAYSEEMDQTKPPTVALSKDVSATLGEPASAWSGNNYKVTYPIINSSQQKEQVAITVTNGYDKAGNSQDSKSGGFGIEMVRTVGVVSFVSTPDGGAHVNKQSTAFAIKATYTAEMQESTIPVISFDKTVAASLTETTKAWSDNSTVYTYNYSAVSSGLDETVVATVSGAKDKSGTAIENSEGAFRIDFAPPLCQITAPDISKATTTHTVTLTYNEEMMPDAPELTITPAQANAILGAMDGSWDATGKIFTANFPVTRTPPGLSATASIKVSAARDAAGNVQGDANQSFTVDQRDVNVSVSMNPTTIQSSTATAIMTLTFNVNMDQTSTPAIAFDPDVQGAITPKANGANWVNSRTYTVEYDLDKTKKVEIQDIDVTVSAAKNTDGETMGAIKAADVFTVNFLAPSCTVTFEPEAVLDEATTFTVTLVYDTDMDMTSTPTLTWGNILDYKQTFTGERFAWTDSRTCVFTYDVMDKNVQNPVILLTASNAKSSTGLEQVKCDATKLLIVDMLDFLVDVTVNSPAINCNSSQLVVSVQFNQPMNETQNNIVSFPNLDPKGFITPVGTEWTTSGNKSTFVAEYAIHPDQPTGSNLSVAAVDVAVAPASNYLGREYTGETFANRFSAASNPPAIDNATAQSPQCYGIENGEIHLAVNGGTTPLTYTWTKDDEPFAATGADATALGAGKYDITVKGSDNCSASYSVTLTNPESVVLTAEVKHHLEKYNDGEVVLIANGGTLPYKYYMDNILQGDKTGYTDLDAGIYNFEVEDANSCKAIASAEVKNYQTPTVFTPNADGFNDTFMEGNKVEIFDRNGTLVHKGNNGWDGRYKGQSVRPAVYFYIVTFTDGYKKKGTIQLYRQ